jgi:hypothetical protein
MGIYLGLALGRDVDEQEKENILFGIAGIPKGIETTSPGSNPPFVC